MITLVYPMYGSNNVVSAVQPLGIMYIASYLKSKDYIVNLIDCQAGGFSVLDCLNRIPANTKYLGISMMTCQVYEGIRLAKLVKKRYPDVTIVAGGPHVIATGSEILNQTDCIDIAVLQEGEHVMEDIVAGKNLNSISGIAYKKTGVISNPRTDYIDNLNQLPFPDLSSIDKERYRNRMLDNRVTQRIITSRGCPHQCSFCSTPVTQGRKLRTRTVENVLDEIQYHMDTHNVHSFVFGDNTFSAGRHYAIELCEGIIDRGLDIIWNCQTRVDSVDYELLRMMKRAGCRMVKFGIESVTEHVLIKMQKGINPSQAKQAVKLCRSLGIKTAGFFMIGNPGESQGDVLKTIRFMRQLGLDYAWCSITKAYPGSQLFDEAMENAWLDPDKYLWIYSKKPRQLPGNYDDNQLIIKTEIPMDDKLQLYRQATRNFYLQPSVILKKIAEVKSLDDLVCKAKMAVRGLA